MEVKFGSVTKPDERNKIMSYKIWRCAMSANCDTIVIFLIYGQFGANRIADA